MKMGTWDTVAMVLVVVGGLNWGLVGLLNYNLVESLLGGPESLLVKVVYDLVGLAAVLVLWKWFAMKK